MKLIRIPLSETDKILPCEKGERCPFGIPRKKQERLKETQGSPCCTCYVERICDAQLRVDQKAVEAIFSAIEANSDVIDWENEEIGVKREFNEEFYAKLKSEYLL
jgi:hypothetical protein